MNSLRKYEGSIEEMFNAFNPTSLAQQTIQIDANKEEFIRKLNEEFSGNGLYFELQEKEFERVVTKVVMGKGFILQK